MIGKIRRFSAKLHWRACLPYLGVAAITLGLLEISSWALFETISGVSFSVESCQKRRGERLELIRDKARAKPGLESLYVPHPYLGYSGRPGSLPWGGPPAFNDFGMLSVGGRPYPYVKKDNEFVVAVLGGSVAEIFSHHSEGDLNKFLDERGFAASVVLINLATGGYKQPQQLYHLIFALLAGFQFDAVLNIDGFNEIVLAADNLTQSINPIYPSSFHMGIMAKSQAAQWDYETVTVFMERHENYRTEETILSLLSRAPLRYSVFANLLSEVVTAASIKRAANLNYQMATRAREEMSSTLRGPQLASDRDPYAQAAAIWQRSSELLHDLCRANDMVYLHILQPNQYVEDSKRLTEREKKAINPKHPWGIAAREGYPRLLEQGEQMKADGLPFYDLTQVFSDVEGDIYTDECCHFDREGNRILAGAIAPLLLHEVTRHKARARAGREL